MRLTDKHIGESELEALIITSEIRFNESGLDWYKCILNASLELKQRRAEERFSEAQNGEK